MRRLIALLIALVALLAAPVHAKAGGPTSLLLTMPGTERAAGLYYTDPRYAELLELIESRAGTGSAPDQRDHVYQPYNLAWLIHDRDVWRFDQVAVDGDDVYVATTMSDFGSGSDGGESGGWQRVAEGDRLVELIESVLGAAPGKASGADNTSTGEMTATEASPPAAEGTPTVEEGATWLSSGWRWLLPGLVLGLLTGLVVSRRARVPAEQRQELVDVEPRRA